MTFSANHALTFLSLSKKNNKKKNNVFYNCPEIPPSFPTDYSIWLCHLLHKIITTILFLFSGSGASEQV